MKSDFTEWMVRNDLPTARDNNLMKTETSLDGATQPLPEFLNPGVIISGDPGSFILF